MKLRGYVAYCIAWIKKMAGCYLLRYKQPVHYIGGSEVLPPPLTKQEEESLVTCISKYKDDRQTLERVKNVLIERNLRLVVYIARKFENTGIGMEDLISIGTIGLIKAINTFNPEKKLSLQLMHQDVLKMKF